MNSKSVRNIHTKTGELAKDKVMINGQELAPIDGLSGGSRENSKGVEIFPKSR